MISPLFFYILKSVLRNRFLWIFVASVVVVVSLSLFMGSSAVTEKDQFALVFIASSLRLVAVFLLTLFVCNYIRQAFDYQEVEYVLSRSISRLNFLISHSFSFLVLSIVLSFFIGGVLFLLPFATHNLLFWVLGFAVELIVISQAAILFSIILGNTIGSVFAVSGFYILGRLIGDILAIIEASMEGTVVTLLENVMLFISFFTPRFDLLVQSQWLLYSEQLEDIFFIFGQCIVLSLVLFVSGYFDFKRKEF